MNPHPPAQPCSALAGAWEAGTGKPAQARLVTTVRSSCRTGWAEKAFLAGNPGTRPGLRAVHADTGVQAAIIEEEGAP